MASGIAAVGRRLPDADIVVVGAVARIVSEEHDIRSVSIATGGAEPRISRFPRPLRMVARPLVEPVRWVSVCRFLRTVDAVIVPGTGILDDMKTGPRQTPYDLFRWTTAARWTRRPVFMVGVGAGPVEHRWSRWLVRRAVRNSRRVTYRDEGSRAFMSALGVPSSADSVQPDVVLARSRPDDHRSTHTGGRHIGLGVMAYYGWRPMSDAAEQKIFDDYIESMTAIAGLLVSHGHTVRLLVGEHGDSIAVERLVGDLRAERGDAFVDALTIEPIRTFDELLEQVARTDAVVATRFHNVVASLMLSRPTVSIGYAEKNRELMSDFGLGAYCHDVERIDPATVVADLERALAAETDMVGALRAHNRELTRQVGERFDEILDEVVGAGPE